MLIPNSKPNVCSILTTSFAIMFNHVMDIVKAVTMRTICIVQCGALCGLSMRSSKTERTTPGCWRGRVTCNDVMEVHLPCHTPTHT